MANGSNLVVIGASAGGLQPLKGLLSALPRSTHAAILVVMHLSRSGESHLPAILAGAGALPAVFPEDKTPVRSGVVYVAPANRHMSVEDSSVRITVGPQENGQRPAIDVLFRSAAESYGRRVIGVVLSGTLDDGAAGLRAIKEAGGVTVVQSPGDADFSSMPEAAIGEGCVDYVLPLSAMPRAVLRLIHGISCGDGDGQLPAPAESRVACSTGRRVLLEVSESGMLPYRAHAGNALSPEAVTTVENGGAVEHALRTALRMVRERLAVTRRMADYARRQGKADLAERYEVERTEAEQTADVLRQLLFPA